MTNRRGAIVVWNGMVRGYKQSAHAKVSIDEGRPPLLVLVDSDDFPTPALLPEWLVMGALCNAVLSMHHATNTKSGSAPQEPATTRIYNPKE